MASSDHPVLEPLCFDLPSHTDGSHQQDQDKSSPVARCMLCNDSFMIPKETGSLFIHLQNCHNVIVASTQNIADVPRYMDYWKSQFESGAHLDQICMTSQDINNSQYVLSETLPKDKDIRLKLQLLKLQEVLDQQQKEREEHISRTCLFCMRHFEGNRSELFIHMSEFHNFDIGDSNNLVYTNQLLTELEEKLRKLQCLYCEKTFKDRPVLMEHMRKKRHKRLRRTNLAYHRFYISNYLQSKNVDGVTTLEQQDDDFDDDDNDNDCDSDDHCTADKEIEWNDWIESNGVDAVCLFCPSTSTDADLLLQHMKEMHAFDLRELIAAHKLTFYHQVKLINFMRRQLHYKMCTFCEEKFSDNSELLDHLSSSGHIDQLPPLAVWNQPQYYFPTFENDSLLCALMDDDAQPSQAAEYNDCHQVVAEDLPEVVTRALQQCQLSSSAV